EAAGTGPPPFPAYLRWGSWVGGDRDGNPSVTAETTRAAMAIQADHVLRGLERVTRRVGHALPVATSSTPPSEELLASLDRDTAAFPRPAPPIAPRWPDEPYLQKLLLAAERLAATRAALLGRGHSGPPDPPGGHPDPPGGPPAGAPRPPPAGAPGRGAVSWPPGPCPGVRGPRPGRPGWPTGSSSTWPGR